MLTAREEREASHNSREQPEPKQAVLRNITYRTDVATMSIAALKFQLCLRGVGVDDPDKGQHPSLNYTLRGPQKGESTWHGHFLLQILPLHGPHKGEST